MRRPEFLQLERDALRCLLSDPGRPGKGVHVPEENGKVQIPQGHGAQQAQRGFRPDPADGGQLHEQLLFLPGGKAEQLHRVLPDGQEGIAAHLFPEGGGSLQGVVGTAQLIAEAAGRGGCVREVHFRHHGNKQIRIVVVKPKICHLPEPIF